MGESGGIEERCVKVVLLKYHYAHHHHSCCCSVASPHYLSTHHYYTSQHSVPHNTSPNILHESNYSCQHHNPTITTTYRHHHYHTRTYTHNFIPTHPGCNMTSWKWKCYSLFFLSSTCNLIDFFLCIFFLNQFWKSTLPTHTSLKSLLCPSFLSHFLYSLELYDLTRRERNTSNIERRGKFKSCVMEIVINVVRATWKTDETVLVR